ncbi:MAG: hypothetical protein J6Y43_06750 [Clostridia bacterium]|nr:hypothetical protein [Clostridia bacterium]
MARKKYYLNPEISIEQMFGEGVDALMTSGPIDDGNGLEINGYDLDGKWW